MHMHTTKLGAAVQCRYRLAGIEQAQFIKSVFQCMEGFQFSRFELYTHGVDFFDAHAVFAGDGAADVDAELEDFGTEIFGTFELTGIIGIVEDQRMQVAVAGMEYIGAAQPVFFSIAVMPRSTSARRFRGMVPSMQ